MTLSRAFAIAFAVAAFLLASFIVARWLTSENRERTAVIDLLRAQAGGDAPSMLAQLDGCAADARCRAVVGRNARTLRRPGDVRILSYDSQTAHSVLAERGTTRVAWDVGNASLPVVQCVKVERGGVPILGGALVLRGIGPKISGDGSC